MDPFTKPEHIQGSAEWLAHRQHYLGASDAAVVMGVSPWMTPLQLWEQKMGVAPPTLETSAMRRGTLMEPEARKAFEDATGLEVFPQIVYHPKKTFMMASLDGLSLDRKHAVEIKCPGAKAHSIALDGNIPEYYMPQLQHQLACIGLETLWYYSYDGNTGVKIEVSRDECYIEDLIEAESAFWRLVQTKTAPVATDRDHEDRDGPVWISISRRLQENNDKIRDLKTSLSTYEDEREMLKKTLIEDSRGRSCRCGSLTLTRSFPKGRIDYSKIPHIKGVNLECFRGEPKETWTLRIKT